MTMYKLGPPYPWMKGDTFLLEGSLLSLSDDPIQPGDTYIAGRNTGPHLLTCRSVGNGCFHPVECAYSFDDGECRKVLAIEGVLC